MRSFLFRAPLLAGVAAAIAHADIQHGILRVIENDGGKRLHP